MWRGTAHDSFLRANHQKINGSNNVINGNNNTIRGSNNEIYGNDNYIFGSNNVLAGNNNKSWGSNNVLHGRGNVCYLPVDDINIGYLSRRTDDIYKHLTASEWNDRGFGVEMMKKKKKKEAYRFEEREDSTTENDSEQCDICMDNKKCMLYNPCNHMASCNTCAKDIWEKTKMCPICRETIQKFIYVFL